jgi:Rrf2 family transcriptional regulator, iron-sulfur cluster assembly transcription factor
MTVFFSKKCELALQAVLFLSVQPEGQLCDAGVISKALKLPKEFISKSLQALTKCGITGSRKGKTGGFYLAKKLDRIHLIDIVRSIAGLQAFQECVLGFGGCSGEHPCPVHHKWGHLREDALKMLGMQTLDEFKDFTRAKINAIK